MREQEALKDYFEANYRSQIRFGNRAGSAFCVLGVVMLSSVSTYGWTALILGALSFLIAFAILFSKNGLRRVLKAIQLGEYLVQECTVVEVGMDDQIGRVTVSCRDRHNQLIPGYYRIRQENISRGSEVLFVYAEVAGVKKPITRVFSPYMLTPEGMKKAW